jgi:hypothetical protein
MNVLMECSHPSICRMLGFSVDGPQRCIVLELCTGGALDVRLACKVSNPLWKGSRRHTLALGI